MTRSTAFRRCCNGGASKTPAIAICGPACRPMNGPVSREARRRKPERNRIDTPPAGRLRGSPWRAAFVMRNPGCRRGAGAELSGAGSGSGFPLVGRQHPRRASRADRPQNSARNLPRLETRRAGRRSGSGSCRKKSAASGRRRFSPPLKPTGHSWLAALLICRRPSRSPPSPVSAASARPPFPTSQPAENTFFVLPACRWCIVKAALEDEPILNL